MVTIAVSKVSVRLVQMKMYAVTLKLTVTDGATEIIDQNFTKNHKIGNSPAYTVNKFLIGMQDYISAYIAEQNIYNAAALDTAIETLEGGLQWQ
jgi:hypothetical protein